MLASTNDGIWFNENTDEEVDLDETFHVDNIKDIVFDEEDQEFYFMSNKKNGMIGMFLVKFSGTDPTDFSDMTLWKHRLEIDNANLYILRGYNSITKNYFKELVISYKTIYINTYNVVV